MALMFTAYFDASGKRNHPVSSVGGVVAPVYKWARFELAWKRVLAAEGVTEFHATDFAASQGEYVSWKGDRVRRAKFLGRLGSIVKANGNKLFCASMENNEWASVNQDYLLEECFHSPYAYCGFAVVKQVLAWAKRKRVKTPVKFIFEKGDAEWAGLEKLCKKIGVAPVELPKEEAIPCQAGDLIAWKSRIAFTNGIRKLGSFMGSPSIEGFDELVEESRSLDKVIVISGTPGIFSRDRLIENCKRFRIPKRALAMKE